MAEIMTIKAPTTISIVCTKSVHMTADNPPPVLIRPFIRKKGVAYYVLLSALDLNHANEGTTHHQYSLHKVRPEHSWQPSSCLNMVVYLGEKVPV